MKIGTVEFPDNCPNCNGSLIKTPRMRLITQGSSYQWHIYYLYCPKCTWKSEEVRIKSKMKTLKKSDIKDATEYKKYFFGLIKVPK